MIITHEVVEDGAQLHVAYVDFRAPFDEGADVMLPTGYAWRWIVSFVDGQDDGTHDDVLIRAWHLRKPHAGEAPRVRLPAHGYIKVGRRDHGPTFVIGAHGRHLDQMTTAIRAAPGRRKDRRLWLRLEHTGAASPGMDPGGSVVPVLDPRLAQGGE